MQGAGGRTDGLLGDLAGEDADDHVGELHLGGHVRGEVRLALSKARNAGGVRALCRRCMQEVAAGSRTCSMDSLTCSRVQPRSAMSRWIFQANLMSSEMSTGKRWGNKKR